jgi:four helix bundle protein
MVESSVKSAGREIGRSANRQIGNLRRIVGEKGAIKMAERGIRSYQDLDVWQVAMEVAERCYKLTQAFPKDELFGLTAQIRRASASVAANIAEGYGRESRREYLQFLRIAQGSQKELETYLLLAVRVGLTTEREIAPIMTGCDRVGKMLHRLIRSLQKG